MTTADSAANTEVVWSELQATNRDLSQVRAIVGDAVVQLFSGFEEIAKQSAEQQRILQASLSRVDAPSNVAGSTKAGTSVSGFIAQSESLVARVTGDLNDASQRTLSLTQSLRRVDDAFRSLVVLTNSIREVSEQIRVLAFNANLEATRARDAGRGFAVVANAVRDLSQNFKDLTEQIRSTVDVARESLSDTVQVAETAANVDQRLAEAARQEMADLHGRTQAINVELAASLQQAGQMSECIQQGVGRCLRGLQFDDLVGQIQQASNARMVACGHVIHASGYSGEGAQSIEALRCNLTAVQHRAVQQSSLDAGEVEFF
jgi:methyl-accepting chemotaxis protein